MSTNIEWTEETWNPIRARNKETDGDMLLYDSHKGGDPSEWPEDLRVREMPQQFLNQQKGE